MLIKKFMQKNLRIKKDKVSNALSITFSALSTLSTLSTSTPILNKIYEKKINKQLFRLTYDLL